MCDLFDLICTCELLICICDCFKCCIITDKSYKNNNQSTEKLLGNNNMI